MAFEDGPFTVTEVIAQERSAIEKGRALRRALIPIVENGGKNHQDGKKSTKDSRGDSHSQDGGSSTDYVGLAISGGGIRSATFALGGLQTLAKRRLLSQLDYLSTVSGGGYIGSWLAAWILHEGFDVVNSDLASDTSVVPVNEKDPHYLEPRPVHYLRRYTSYLTPKVGLVSGDTWAAVAIYLRNLLLNQAILIGCLILLLMAPRVMAWSLQSHFFKSETNWQWMLLGLFCLAWLCASYFAGVGLKAFHYSGSQSRPDGAFSRKQKSRLQPAWFAAPVIVSAFLASIALYAERKCPSVLLTAIVFRSWGWHCLTPALIIVAAGMVGVAILTGLTALWAMIGQKSMFAGMDYVDVPPVRKANWRWVLGGLSAGAAFGGLLCLYWQYGFQPYSDQSALWVTTFGPLLLIMMFVLSGWLQLGIMGTAFPDAKREWLARAAGIVIVVGGIWTIVSAVALYSPVLFGKFVAKLSGASLSWLVPPAWITTVLGGLKAANSGKTGGAQSNRWLEWLAKIAPPVFLLGLGMALAWIIQLTLSASPTGVSDIASHLVGDDQQIWWLLGAAVIGALLIFFVDVNEFSMHLFYRNRLVRAYLGASNLKRNPHPFTGFAADDDVRLKDLDPDNPPEDSRHKPYAGPYYLVCTALNLVSGDDLAWQQRKATSFVYSAKFCGYDHLEQKKECSPETREETLLKLDADHPADPGTKQSLFEQGYRATRCFSGPCGPHLGTAMAASGAAASPNMGYHSSPAVAALMTFFDIRLGWWVGNPRDHDTWRKYGPAPYYLLNELLSKSDDESDYLYLSDGGHFENLGVYELVRRRLKLIIAFDGDSDSEYGFGDLGNLIEKCRRDLGAEIDINIKDIAPGGDPPFSKYHFAVGRITYRRLNAKNPDEHGWLIFIKSSMCGGEPEDVLAYRRAHSIFPHDPTADQFFTESQFESYRALGQHAVACALTSLFGDAPVSAAEMIRVLENLPRFP